jgi:hypothetical protein
MRRLDDAKQPAPCWCAHAAERQTLGKDPVEPRKRSYGPTTGSDGAGGGGGAMGGFPWSQFSTKAAPGSGSAVCRAAAI